MSRKIYISADIEGTAGACLWECGREGNREYEQQCEIMKREILAVVDEINQMEDDCQITIKDAHGRGCNFDILDIPENCNIVRGWDDGPYCMMQELDETYDAVIMLGYHCSAGTNNSPMAHTFNSHRYSKILLNDSIMSEFIINYYIAGLFRVPVIMVSGDKAICEEVNRCNNKINSVILQEGKGGSIICVSEKKAETLLRTSVRKAWENQNVSYPDLPVHFKMDISYISHIDTNKSSYYPGCIRIDSNTVRFESNNFYEVLRALVFL